MALCASGAGARLGNSGLETYLRNLSVSASIQFHYLCPVAGGSDKLLAVASILLLYLFVSYLIKMLLK